MWIHGNTGKILKRYQVLLSHRYRSRRHEFFHLPCRIYSIGGSVSKREKPIKNLKCVKQNGGRSELETYFYLQSHNFPVAQSVAHPALYVHNLRPARPHIPCGRLVVRAHPGEPIFGIFLTIFNNCWVIFNNFFAIFIKFLRISKQIFTCETCFIVQE